MAATYWTDANPSSKGSEANQIRIKLGPLGRAADEFDKEWCIHKGLWGGTYKVYFDALTDGDFDGASAVTEKHRLPRIRSAEAAFLKRFTRPKIPFIWG